MLLKKARKDTLVSSIFPPSRVAAWPSPREKPARSASCSLTCPCAPSTRSPQAPPRQTTPP
jgi:hypothetical protein